MILKLATLSSVAMNECVCACVRACVCVCVCFSAATDDGLCCRLTKACPTEPEPIPFKDIEVKRHEIVLTKKLGQGQFGEVHAGRNIVLIVKQH